MSGEEERDTRNLAARRRQAHREEVLTKLRNAGLIQQVLEDANKLSDETLTLDAVMVSRIKAAADLRLKMVSKWLPDVKAVEVTGEDGGDIKHFHRVERVIVRPDNTNS